MWKCYIKNNYLFLENGDLTHRKPRKNVTVYKESIQSDRYFFKAPKNNYAVIDLTDLTDEHGTTFTKESFDEFITLNTGCNVSNSGNSFFPKPIITDPKTINIENGKQTIFTLAGDYFTESTTLFIPGSVIDNVIYVNSHELTVTVTAGLTDGLFDLTITNEGGSRTYTELLSVNTETFIDLSSNGTPLTIGTVQGVDIRHSGNTIVNRTNQGLEVKSAYNDYTQFIKFDFLSFLRGNDTTVEMVFSNDSQYLILGLCSSLSDDLAIQYQQMESSIYLNSKTNSSIFGIYGNNGDLGVLTKTTQTESIDTSGFLKLKIERDGGNRSIFSIYKLISNSIDHIKDETNRIYRVVSTLSPDDSILIPIFNPIGRDTLDVFRLIIPFIKIS